MLDVVPENAILIQDVSKRFQKDAPPALDHVCATFPKGRIIGLVGPDAAGKTTLMRLMAGLMLPTEGSISLLGEPANLPSGGSQPFVGYMPQRFGLYEDLTVYDNLNLHATLRDLAGAEREELFERLLSFTDLKRFTGRLAGRLSGGMKQKLGLACALIGTPRILLLDEPGVGVDPQSRRELWRMVTGLAGQGMTVVWSTAYMDEAERCDWVLMLDQGHALQEGKPSEFLDKIRGRTFFVRPPAQDGEHGASSWTRQAWNMWAHNPSVRDVLVQGRQVRILLGTDVLAHSGLTQAPPRLEDAYMDALGGIDKTPSPFASFPRIDAGAANGADVSANTVIRAVGLTKQYGSFIAAGDISFEVCPGKIFGLLGPNGAGKSTTFRMLCGLSKPTRGECYVAGVNLLKSAGEARAKLGYMAQKFSLYGDISVERNIRLFGDLYEIPRPLYQERRAMLLEALELEPYLRMAAQDLPLGQKQRLALLCATLHGPSALFLDEPTSGVDPRTRREFWKHINALTDIGVAVLVTTHFMEEAEYCDDIALIYRGRVIATGTPDSLKDAWRGDAADATLEDAFIACIETYNKDNPL